MWNKTWAGVGIKGGGMLGVVGADTLEGSVFRLDSMPMASISSFNFSNLRVGMGLGGSIGVSAVFVFNANTLYEANGLRPPMDWGINLALPEGKIGGASITFKALGRCGKLIEIIDLLRKSTPKDIENFRNIASLIYTYLNDYQEGSANNKSSKSSKPTVVVFDVPGVGSGAELSAFASWGEFNVVEHLNLPAKDPEKRRLVESSKL